MSNTTKPRRFVRTFKPRFAPLVKTGRKRQTVRPRPKRMPRPGDIFDAREWSGRPYGSPQNKLGEFVISAVEDIEIYGDSIQVAGRRLTGPEREEFAKADGFESFEDMAGWFSETHGFPFEGILICWK